MFVDSVNITVKAGNGGSGLASFRREKFLPFGGPDGGDGGKGGSVYLVADNNMDDLNIFKHRSYLQAANGGRGGPNLRHGLNADDLLIRVPVGTMVYERKGQQELLKADLLRSGQKVLILHGGKGGKGNVHFATSTRKAPTKFQPGEKGEQLDIILKIRILVDVCLLGFANCGKSSLLSAISAAKPDIADYPFTTRQPVLAVVDDGTNKYIWAELPALGKGKDIGKGPGDKLLAQAERAAVLVYIIDAASQNMEEEFNSLKKAVIAFDARLVEKQGVIAVNKIDLVENRVLLEQPGKKLEEFGLPVYYLSVKEKYGLIEFTDAVNKLVKQARAMQSQEVQPEVIFRPKPVEHRN